jgi:tetratricopeptide (TPR) repeat protein
MGKEYSVPGLLGIVAAALLILSGADEAQLGRDRLQRHRNLGKAFYENPTGAAAAVEEFRKALDIAPGSIPDRLNYGLALLRAGKAGEGIAELEQVQKLDAKLPHTWFNLGIQYKKLGRYPEAMRQLERFAQLVPDDAVSRYNLGLLHQLDGQPDLALKQFQLANGLNPILVAPYFQVYNVYRLGEDEQRAGAALAAFQEAKSRQKEADESEDMEWNAYSEIYDPIELARASNEPPAEARFLDRKLDGALDPATAGALATDIDGDGRPDLLVWSKAGVRIYRNGVEPAAASGLEELRQVVSAAAGDFDNDGLADLCVLTESGPALYRNAKGRYRKVAANLPAGRFQKALWIDYDHDYDLDLLLFGSRPALLRNQGTNGFVERNADFPFAPGEAMDAVALRTMSDEKSMDVAVAYRDRAGVLYRDRLRGRFEATPLDGLPARAGSLAALDANNDGWMDLGFSGPKGAGLLLNRKGRFESVATAVAGSGAAVFADLENRGVAAPGFRKGAAWVAADFDNDGRTDLAGVAGDGSLHLLLNRTATRNGWLKVSLAGVKNLILAQGAEVEVKAGAAYQKRLYDGLPLLFGLGAYREADTVRITWPNGMIQNETGVAAGRVLRAKEAPRMSGSCPMVFTWNGTEFQFITDVLGVAPLGASSGDGGTFPLDHDEYVQIPPGALAERNGRFEVRITEELHEVSYLDRVQLVAVDHPSGTEIFTNDKFKSPPFPEFRLFGAERRIHPVRATDHHGHDVLERVLRTDRRYPDDFRRNAAGVAEMHHLDLDFGPAAASGNRAALALGGWVDWADGSTFLAASQEAGGGLRPPYLQVKDAGGAWRTVIEDLGMPAGKPKTMVADLAGKFLSAAREIRIVTSLCVYWDEIFLIESSAAPAARLTPIGAAQAELRFRGFSKLVIDPAGKQPEVFDYERVSATSIWSPTPGLYTRYGDVRELVESIDDRMVITGSGDELKLLFDARAVPPLEKGWTRDFLLLVDGWSKDADANTAFGASVEPLPFHKMSGYPYRPDEKFPDDARRREWRRTYNTRQATTGL